MTNPLILEHRREATQKTLNEWRGREFDWRTSTCVHLVHSHLTNMGRDIPDMPEFNTPLGAKRALKTHGWGTVREMLDGVLTPITPAAMWVGDIAVTPGQDGFDSILISAGPLKLMGWHPDTGEFVLYHKGMGAVTGAWRA